MHLNDTHVEPIVVQHRVSIQPHFFVNPGMYTLYLGGYATGLWLYCTTYMSLNDVDVRG